MKNKYSLFSLIKNSFSYHENWQRAWRDPEPKPSYDAIIVGGGGHGLATAYYLAKEHNLKNIAKNFKNKFFNIRDLKKMDDNLAIDYITQLKGLGVWSAQMFLMFNLNRPDIFPTKDIGLIRAISKNYKTSYPPSERFLNKISKMHSGYRSVFTWYMWRSIDPVDVEY